MIQRIQSIYLLLAAVSLILTAFFGFSSYQVGSEEEILFNLFGITGSNVEISVWFPYKIVVPLIAALCIYSIVKFKNRKLQLFIGKVLYLLILLLLVFIFIDVFGVESKIKMLSETVTTTYGLGLYLSVISLPFVFLANRSINKDEKLVRDVDRLR